MNSKHKQGGFSIASIAFIILLVSFFGTLLVKLGPIYNDHFYLTALVKDLSLEAGSSNKSIRELRESMRKNLLVNNVTFDLANLTLDKSKGSVPVLVLNYETRVHVLFNIDAVVVFNEEYITQP